MKKYYFKISILFDIEICELEVLKETAKQFRFKRKDHSSNNSFIVNKKDLNKVNYYGDIYCDDLEVGLRELKLDAQMKKEDLLSKVNNLDRKIEKINALYKN